MQIPNDYEGDSISKNYWCYFAVFVFYLLLGAFVFCSIGDSNDNLNDKSKISKNIQIASANNGLEHYFVKVKIISHHTENCKKWYLLECCDDKQRCTINHYRGKPGDTFLIHSSELKGYYLRNKEIPIEVVPIVVDSDDKGC